MNEFNGTAITIRYDEKICTHSGNCVRGLPGVFDISRTPWVNADGAAVDAIRKAIGACPSGALTYEEPKTK